MEHLIIGTAGHVDHGKTVLIKALTGIDTDRLHEEKIRGISIDLGFAPFQLPGGRTAGVVDVPGHERFIHNMLAGAAGMDLVMLVIDASEGIMPQTREHLDILQLLGIQKGIVVVTKIDLVEEEWRELLIEEIREELNGTFLENALIHAVSALKGEGVDQLKELIDQETAALKPRSSSGPLRLPVDRSFSIAGFGTVITGTLIQGSVKVGDTVAVVPPGIEARVRNVQVHDHDVSKAVAGSRVALNLSGLEKTQVSRGSVVSAPGYYRLTALIDVSLKLLPGAPRRIKNLDPVHFFLGSARSTARLLLLDRDRINPGEDALVQCRLDRPLVAERGDSFVIRSYSPMTTIGGGLVLDPHPSRHRRLSPPVITRLKELKESPASGSDAVFVLGKLEELTVAGSTALSKETRLDQQMVESILENQVNLGAIHKLGNSYGLTRVIDQFEQKLLEELNKYQQANPLSFGMSRARLKGFLPKIFGQHEYDALLAQLSDKEKITVMSDLVSLFQYEPKPSEKDQQKLAAIAKLYRTGSLQPPSVKEVLEKTGVEPGRRDEIFGYLLNKKILVRVGEELFFHTDAYQEALKLLQKHFSVQEKLTLGQFRDQTGSSRKYIQALLEHFDQIRLTRRIDDYRVAAKSGQTREGR